MIIKEYVAFQTVDSEGDIWCNKAFLFKTNEEAESFFSDVSNIMNALGWELEEDEEGIMETIEEVQSSLKVFKDYVFEGCEFSCNGGGSTRILQMSTGFVIREVAV